MYHSDIRSMINFLQLNQNFQLQEWDQNVMNSSILETMRTMFRPSGNAENNAAFSHAKLYSKTVAQYTYQDCVRFVHNISIKHNMDKTHIMNAYFNYIIRNYPHEITPEFLNVTENVMHNTSANIGDILEYFCIHLMQLPE
jgi:pantothenate kinase